MSLSITFPLAWELSWHFMAINNVPCSPVGAYFQADLPLHCHQSGFNVTFNCSTQGLGSAKISPGMPWHILAYSELLVNSYEFVWILMNSSRYFGSLLPILEESMEDGCLRGGIDWHRLRHRIGLVRPSSQVHSLSQTQPPFKRPCFLRCFVRFCVFLEMQRSHGLFLDGGVPPLFQAWICLLVLLLLLSKSLLPDSCTWLEKSKLSRIQRYPMHKHV